MSTTEKFLPELTVYNMLLLLRYKQSLYVLCLFHRNCVFYVLQLQIQRKIGQFSCDLKLQINFTFVKCSAGLNYRSYNHSVVEPVFTFCCYNYENAQIVLIISIMM